MSQRLSWCKNFEQSAVLCVSLRNVKIIVWVSCALMVSFLEWSTVSDPSKAISQCANHFLHIHAMESSLTLSMDIRRSPAEQDMALISFYKQTNVEWARPLKCRLEGKSCQKIKLSNNNQNIRSNFTCFYRRCCYWRWCNAFFFSQYAWRNWRLGFISISVCILYILNHKHTFPLFCLHWQGKLAHGRHP